MQKRQMKLFGRDGGRIVEKEGGLRGFLMKDIEDEHDWMLEQLRK